MKRSLFSGEAISFEDQVRLLESQGLIIEDRSKTIHILQNVSYSRLKAYMVPFMEERTPRRFIPGTTFDLVYSVYGFDRRLRELIFHELEKVEISIRARIGYASSGAEAGYWFLHPEYFISKRKHEYILRHLGDEIKRSSVDAIKRFHEKYSNDFPPCWITLEAASMGTLSFIYDALAPGKMKDDIALYYGVDAGVFASWLRHLVYIRNVCAHHNRLWNNSLDRGAAIPDVPGFPRQVNRIGDRRQKVYTTLCVIKFLQDTVKPDNSFALRLKTLLKNYPQIDSALMGFPDGWQSHKFWNTKEE